MPDRPNSYVAIVDGDESLCRSFARLLRTAGYQSITYPSAEAFLGDSKRPRFDCLVLDFQLQGVSGLELNQRLSAVKDNTPVLFITASDEPEDRSAAEAAGCAGYFRKTDPGTLILEAIQNAVHCPNEPEPPRSPPPSDTVKTTVINSVTH